MATDFVRAQQLLNSFVNLQQSQAKFAETGAQAPTITIAFQINHPADPANNIAASVESVNIPLLLPTDVAASAANSVAQVIGAAMAAMGLPTS